MAKSNINPFPGNSRKMPEQIGLGPVEAPIIRQEIQEGDASVHDIYAHVIHMPLSRVAVEAAAESAQRQYTGGKVIELSNHPRYEYTGSENNPEMAEEARRAIYGQNPLIGGEQDAQEAA